MRTAISLLLIVTVTGSADSALADSVLGLQEPTVGTWADVQHVASGTEVFFTDRNNSNAQRVFLGADGLALYLVDPAALRLSRTVERELREIVAADAAQILAGGTVESVNGDVRIGRDGLFVMNRKLGEWSEVVQRVDRGDLQELSSASTRRGLSALETTGAGAAIGAGVGLALSISVFRCGACVESWTRVLVLVGAGAGAAVGGSIAAARSARPNRDHRVIYSVQ
jgi:hypothetical protein